jgi:hypothetical protein
MVISRRFTRRWPVFSSPDGEGKKERGLAELTGYSYLGARSLVLLHEHHLREFLVTWKKAKAAGVALPPTDDPSYVSMAALLRHVLRAARGYMTWMCQVLELPAPEIQPTPEVDRIEAESDTYLEHVLDGWRTPLKEIPEQQFHEPTYPSRWKVQYCIDAMMEHAVMHPIRHSFQLRELMAR